jgi:hypothetical protein
VYFNQKQQIINQKNDVVIQNDAANKPTVVSDNEKSVAVVSKTNQEEVSKFNFKTKSDIVSSNSNQNQVVVSINNLLKEILSVIIVLFKR